MKCVMCGNKLLNENRDIFRRVHNRRVRIIDVPVEVCFGCGDIYIDDQEIEVIELILEKLKLESDDSTEPIIVDFNLYNEKALV